MLTGAIHNAGKLHIRTRVISVHISAQTLEIFVLTNQYKSIKKTHSNTAVNAFLTLTILSSSHLSIHRSSKQVGRSAVTYLNLTSPLILGKMQNDNMSSCTRYKQRFIGTVENYALYAKLRIIAQWVIAADLKCTSA